MDRLFDLRSSVRVGYADPGIARLQNHGIGENIRFMQYSRLRRFKRLMGHKAHSVGISHQRVTGDSRFSLVCLGKTAIDNEQLSAAFDRRLPFFQLHRNMSVHNMGMLAVQPELFQDFIDHILIIQQLVITVFCFLMRFLLFYKISFKGRHFVLAEHWRTRPFPNIPYHILAFLHLGRVIFGIITLSGILIQNIIQCLSAVFFPVDSKSIKIAVFIHGHASMVQQIGIIYFI